jgi:hypothetical protein
MATLNVEGDAFHHEWNYTVKLRCREAPLEAPILQHRLSVAVPCVGFVPSRFEITISRG